MKPLNIIGLVIFFVGVLALVGFGFYKSIGDFLISEDIPVVIKWGIIALVLGIIIILISLVFERARDSKEENDHNNIGDNFEEGS